MRLLERLKRFFGRKPHDSFVGRKVRASGGSKDAYETSLITKPGGSEKRIRGSGDPEPSSMTSDTPLIPHSRIHSNADLLKFVRQQKIANANQERDRSRLGYGLNHRNFKPRPAAEKQLWDLSKKPVEED